MLEYNLEGGKMIRGKLCISIFESLKNSSTLTTIEDAYIVGWAIEIVFALINRLDADVFSDCR